VIHTAANGERGATRVVSSGLGLGHYLPALAIRHELRMMGIEAGVDVYEEHLDPARRMRIDATKHAYRNNPRLAMVGERLSGSLAPELDHAPLASVVACWESERVERLIVLSGYWWQAVELYWRKCWPRRCDIQWCHIDAADSPSWKTVPEDNHGRHVWPASAARGEVTARIRMSRQTVMPFRDRSRRFLVHGGAWGRIVRRRRICCQAAMRLTWSCPMPRTRSRQPTGPASFKMTRTGAPGPGTPAEDSGFLRFRRSALASFRVIRP